MNNSTSFYNNLSAVHFDVFLRQPWTSSKDYQLYLYYQLEIVYELGIAVLWFSRPLSSGHLDLTSKLLWIAVLTKTGYLSCVRSPTLSILTHVCQPWHA